MSYIFDSKNSEKIIIEKLSYAFCKEHAEEVLNIINTIPFIEWTNKELLSSDMDYYGDKWNYSYGIFNQQREIIGILIAYFRKSDDKHIFDSLYIHKLAIKKNYQHMGIGTHVLKYFIQKSFKEIPWLLNITVQTNRSPQNMYVINFYKYIGFNEMYEVFYPNKIDILLLLERCNYSETQIGEMVLTNLNLKHPRFNVSIDNEVNKNVLPVIYFSSTNEKKKEIVKFIFHNYNIEVNFKKTPVELTEPQIEKPNLEEERKLVSLPLKSVSRFITTVPYIIEDTMLFIEFFNRNGTPWELPGLDTKRWLRQMGLDGLLDIMGRTTKRKAKFVSQTGAYVKANKYFYGRGEITGTISYKQADILPYKYGTYPYFFHLIFIPDGASKTLAEMDMHEYAQHDYMRKSILNLIDELSNETLIRQCTILDQIEEDFQ